ncbi:hypothetical protein PF010_g7259 [Phytophthora fragariae]|uniref:Uncharacterized protein n=1 Tax=Phytophthora fragariae TaxID=53985 RepID=A0A6G0LHW8_9STRA|nr:hypothetical protein PF010_g7259 [Phytophthora fragariae]
MQPAVARRETWRRKEAHARRQLSKRSVRDGKAAAGEFVRLAAAIDDCAAFNPKQWRHVLESATVLRHGGQTTSNLSNKKQTATHRPFSREEDTLVEGVTVFPPLSVTQYLNQPDLVEDILREAEGQVRAEQQQVEEKDVNAEKEESVLVDPEVQAEGEGGEGGLEMEENMVEQEGVSPIRDDIVLKKNSTVMLPLLTTMSPRTRRGVAHLPPPSEAEVREIESFERLVDHPEFYEDFYRVLNRSRMQQAQHRSAMKVEKTDAQPFQRPTSLRKMKRPRGAIKPLQARKAGDTQPAALPALSAEDVDPTRGLDKQNCVEKEDNTRADFTSTVMVKQPSNQFKTPNRNRKPRRSSSYNRLIQERQYAEALHGAAEYQVKETLAEIKQWIPLDLIYAFGFGKFASPAQQRATEVMFRVGVRLKSQLLFLAMPQTHEKLRQLGDYRLGGEASRFANVFDINKRRERRKHDVQSIAHVN